MLGIFEMILSLLRSGAHKLEEAEVLAAWSRTSAVALQPCKSCGLRYDGYVLGASALELAFHVPSTCNSPGR
jgi:hypothetical protein